MTHSLQTELKRLLNIDIELVVNENRSTMLNLLEKKRSFVRLSVHKMFLYAPEHVIYAIAHFVKGARQNLKQRNQILREFIQGHLSNVDYTHTIDPRKLDQQGKVFQLKPLYDILNEKYFENKLDLSLTWYGKAVRTRRNRIIFGQYLSGLRLIKMHRMLDDHFFPEYFVSFILYHEMLHSVIPGAMDARGRFCCHGKDFKARERAFEYYHKAMEWEKTHKEKLFGYGWT